MAFGNYKNEKGYANINDEKVDLEYSEYPENSPSDVLEVQDEPGCKKDTETSTEQPKKYKFKDLAVFWACALWYFVTYESFWKTLPERDEKRWARKEILAQFKSQLEEDGKREGTIRLIHTIWSDYLSSAQRAMAFPIGLTVMSVLFCSVWLIRCEFSNQNRLPAFRAVEASFLFFSVSFCVLTYIVRSKILHSIEKDIVTFISRGEW